MWSPITAPGCLSQVTNGIFIAMEVAAIIQSGSLRFDDLRIWIVCCFISSEICSILSSLRKDSIALFSCRVNFFRIAVPVRKLLRERVSFRLRTKPMFHRRLKHTTQRLYWIINYCHSLFNFFWMVNASSFNLIKAQYFITSTPVLCLIFFLVIQFLFLRRLFSKLKPTIIISRKNNAIFCETLCEKYDVNELKVHSGGWFKAIP